MAAALQEAWLSGCACVLYNRLTKGHPLWELKKKKCSGQAHSLAQVFFVVMVRVEKASSVLKFVFSE